MTSKHELTELLNHVADGSISPDDAALKLKIQPFQEIGEYAKVDFHRGIRQGVPEVIYGAGKAKEHILGIAKAMVNNGQKTILITRLSEEAAEFVKRELPLNYNSMAHVGIIGEMPEVSGKGRILVATGGTSDIPVAEEAALTAEALGNDVLRLYDVGVSGIHRLLSQYGHCDECPGNYCRCGYGRRTAFSGGRPRGLPGNRRSHQRGLRRGIRRRGSTAEHAQLLCQRNERCQH